MNIVILANFPILLDGSLQGRFINLASLFHDRGHHVEVIVSDFDHYTKKNRQSLGNKYPFKLTYLHETGYPNNVHPKRLWSHYVWGKNVYRYIKTLKAKPDVVYAALPTFTAGKLVGQWCNKNGVKFVIDVQDLWPEAFRVAIKNPFLQLAFKPMDWIADSAYKAADGIIGVSDTYCNRAMNVNSKVAQSLTIYLGNNGGVFENARSAHKVQKSPNEFWVAYIGTMGYSYDLKCAIDAFCKIKSNSMERKIKFIAIGAGPLLDEYKKYARKKGINAEFTGALPYDKMVGLMCSCDAVINCLRPGAAQSITNKVGDYALSGLPVINTQENPEYRTIVEDWQCGINCECGNSDQVADAIAKLAQDEKLRKSLGVNAARLGREMFDRRYTYPKIIEAVEAICKK